MHSNLIQKPRWRSRLFWSVAFILATITAGYFINTVYAKWDETPVIVSIGARTTQLTDIPFPAITICTMNEVRKSEADRINKSKNKTDILFQKLMKDVCNNSNKEKPITKYSNKSDGFDTILNFMVTVRQPCHEMIKACYFAGDLKNCTDIFNPSLTDEGICCSFNKVKREYIFRNPRNLSDLNVTFPMDTVDWTPEAGYPPSSSPDTLPWRPRGSGTHLGLTIVLDAELQQFHCSTSASVGFKLLLHNPVETPKIADFGSLIAPGREYRIKIKPVINNSTMSLRNVKEVSRQCAYSQDKYLQFYRTYTKRNCILECEANYTFDVCKCVPFYLPKDINTPICGKEEESCANKARKLLDMKILKEGQIDMPEDWINPVCQCLPGCNEISYVSSMTHSHMNASFAANKGYIEEAVLLNDEMRNSITVVHLYFTETQFLSYYKTELFGLSEFLSSTGGLLGLFIGFSFLSAVEILYFASVRLWCGIVRRRNTAVNNYPFVE
ncbi:pickpocket protein 28-like isoform X2 [Zootermopsis nevadensis]|uniref:pickpocket protein 28-like isoform X2 n=1 Tax=Zootermopsis nevadensis TaxID=136037 RepID=UPI000B8E3830|nr:pickpocket protein 28-like isoform X2 [Zootermopsis nevadensis]